MAGELEAIFGEGDEKQRMMMLAQQLARQGKLGLAGMASGDEAMGQAGQAAYRASEISPANIANNWETGKYRQYQEKLGGMQQQEAIDKLKQTAREGDLDRQNRLDVAKIQADAALNKISNRPMPQGLQGQLAEAATGLGSIVSLEQYNTAAKEGGINLGKVKGIPLTRGATNAVAGVLGGDITSAIVGKVAGEKEGADVKASAAWWREYKKLYALGATHTLFGSALTKNEQERWDAANINENADDDTRSAALKTMREIAQAHYDMLVEPNAMVYGDDRMAPYDPTRHPISIGDIDRRLGGGKETIGTQTGGGPKLINRSARPQSSPQSSSAASAGSLPRLKMVQQPDGTFKAVPM